MKKAWGTSIYDIDCFAPVEENPKLYEEKNIRLDPELWGKFNIDDLSNVDFSKWNCAKLMSEGVFSDELSIIPNDTGGIYVYCIEPSIIPNAGSYIMYIGKATKTRSESLYKRVQAYKADLTDSSTRPKIHRLLNLWGNYIYVHFLPIAGDEDEITALEDRLIAAYGRPPCNAELRIKSVREKIDAY